MMSRHGSAPLRRFAVALFVSLAAVAIYACTERSDIVDVRRPTTLTFTPRYSNVGANSAPIVRIRVTVKSVTSNAIVAADTIDVDPAAASWTLNLAVPGDAGTVIALFELLNSTGGIEFSGQTGPIAVAPGETSNPTTPVELFPGPLDNLSVTAISISPHSQNVVEGGTVQLTAAISGGGANTHLAWESLDAAVGTVDGNGLVTTTRNGTVRIRAAAGPRADTAVLTVTQRPASIRVTPDTVRVTTLNSEGVFTGTVFDPRNAAIAGEAITWSSSNAGVAESLGNGRFRAAGGGTAQITATSASNTALRANAVMIVTPRAARVVVTPGATTLDVGATIQLNAAVQDANGNAVAGTVVWRTANAAIATVSATGFVTAAGAGSTQIRAVVGAGTPDSVSGIASLTVTQSVRTVEASPDGASFQSIGDTIRFSAVAKDGAGVPVPNIRFTWSAAGGVVTIDSTGLARAVANGSGTVTATALGVTGTVSVSVAQRVTSMTLTPLSDTVVVGDSVPFTAVGKDARNNVVTGAVFNWTSSDTTVATVRSTGYARGRAAGTATIRATSSTNTAVTATASLLVQSGSAPPPPPPTSGPAASVAIQAGDGQTSGAGGAVAIPPAVIVRDSSGNPVNGVNVTFAVATGGGSIVGPAVVATGSNGIAAVGGWTLGTTPGSNTLTATVGSLPSVTFTATGATVAPAISLALGGGRTNVGVSFTSPLTVSLNTPAPTGGVTITVTSSDTTKVRVVSPGTVFIAAGGTTGTVSLTGVAAGSATLTGTGSGYATATLPVTVSLRLISLPLSLNVPYTQSASLPVQLAEPAPTGGTVVTLVIADTTKLTFPSGTTAATTTVTVPAGSTTANATVFGRLPGSTTITASAADYVNGSTPVTVQANLDIVQSSLSINQSFGGTLDVRFQTSGSPIAAPSPGLTVNLSAANSACVSVPATATIATGLTQVSVSATYGGTATLPCTTKVYATASNIAGDSVTVSVSSLPLITTSNIPLLGRGLQSTNSFFLGASNHGGVTVHIVSNDTTRLRVSTSSATLGGSAIDIFIPNGQTSGSYTIQGVAPDTGAVSITVSAPGFTTATQNLSIVQPVYELQSLSSTSVYSTPQAVVVRVGISSNNTSLTTLQSIRAGATAPTFTLTSSDSTKAKLITVTDTARVVSVSIPVGQFASGSGVSGGGAALLPLSAGTVSVTASTTAGMTPMSTATRTVTISAPTISPNTNFARIGAGLQYSVYAQLGASNHGGVTVHIQSNDTTRLLISPNGTTAGRDAIDVIVSNNDTYVPFYVQARERTSNVVDTVTVTIAAAGFTSSTSSWIIAPLAVDVSGLTTSTVALATPVFFPVRVGPANTVNTSLANFNQTPRAGGPGVPITVTLSDSLKAKLVYGTDTLGVVNATIQPNESYLTVYFKPLQAGVDTVRASSTAAGVTVTSGTRAVTIAAPALQLTRGLRVGSGLQDYTGNYLSAAQHGGVTIHLVSSDSTKMLLASNNNVAGHGTLDIAMPNGSTYFTYYLQALEGVTGNVTVTVSAPGFTTDTATQIVVQPALQLSGPATTTTTLSGDQTFNVYIGSVNSNNTGLANYQTVRFGGTGYIITINSSTTAGQLLTSDTTQRGGTITTPIAPLSYYASARFRPLTAGTTLLTTTAPGVVSTPQDSRSVTVTAPGFSYLYSTIVGAGLMTQSSGQLAAGVPSASFVRIRSSNPTVAKVSLNSTTAGADSVDIPMSAGQSYFSYYVHGMDGQTGTVTLTASSSGFTDGNTTAQVVTPGYQISNLSTQYNTASDPAQFYVYVGVPNSNNTSLQDIQAIRFGGTARSVTVTSSDATKGKVGLLPDTIWTNTVTATIPAGSYYTRVGTTASLYFLPVAAGTTTVTASMSGFVAQTPATVNVTVSTATFTNLYSSLVGAGLMEAQYFYLSGGHHGGVTVHLVSADSTKMLLSKTDAEAGTGSIDVVLAEGTSVVSYYVHGVELRSGLVNMTVSAPGFASQSVAHTITTPAVDISNLSSTWSVAYGNDPMAVRVGVRDPNGGNYMYDIQQVRTGSPGLVATVTSSNTAVGTLETSAGAGSPKTLTIAAGQYQTPYYASNGGVDFKPVAPGSVTISASIPNFIQLANAVFAITVTN